MAENNKNIMETNEIYAVRLEKKGVKPTLPYLWAFKSNVRETWRVILVSEADIFLSESLRILAERLSQSEIGLPLRQICYFSPPEEVGVFSTDINI